MDLALSWARPDDRHCGAQLAVTIPVPRSNDIGADPSAFYPFSRGRAEVSLRETQNPAAVELQLR